MSTNSFRKTTVHKRCTRLIAQLLETLRTCNLASNPIYHMLMVFTTVVEISDNCYNVSD